jgi:polyhydroxyalkanoate synthase
MQTPSPDSRLPTLPLMLNLELLLGQITRSALLPWKQPSPPSASAWGNWSSSWPTYADAMNPLSMMRNLLPKPAAVPPHLLPQLAQEVENLLQKRLSSLNHGIQRYQASDAPKHRSLLTTRQVIWQVGNTQLRFLPPTNSAVRKPPVFLVPSLINRATILDLLPGFSLAEALSQHGHAVYVLDWNTPGAMELRYDAAAYVAQALLPAMHAACLHAQAPMQLLGYCMGGILAIAAAQLAPSMVARMALLATPWDFCAPPLATQQLLPHQLAALEQWLSTQQHISPQTLEHWFYLQSPWSVHAKFRQLAELKQDTTAEAFLAAENWLHDGVPLTAPTARDGWVNWGHHNTLLHGRWRVLGQSIRLAQIPHPTLIISPREDAIVPPASSKPLVKQLPQRMLHEPATGHIGALVGQQRHSHLVEPLLNHFSSM